MAMMSGEDISMAMAGETRTGWAANKTIHYYFSEEQRQSQHYKGFDETAQVVQLAQGGHVVIIHIYSVFICIISYGLEVDTMSEMQDSCSKHP